MIENGTQAETWRDYQRRLKQSARRQYYMRRVPWLLTLSVAGFAVLFAFFCTAPGILAHLEDLVLRISEEEKPALIRPRTLKREDLVPILAPLSDRLLAADGDVPVLLGDRKLTVEPSLDPDLQKYVSTFLRRTKTHQAAVVVLRPENGQILAMADYTNPDAEDEENLCLTAKYPAASLFKIVAAAAAIDARGFTPEKSMYFRGRRYTLYRNQLKKERGRYAEKISFKHAFGSSINPVFGKLGIHELGSELVGQYAGRFYFNQVIPFDLPVPPSHLQVPGDEFGLAEIASGFNKTTVISPLHAALLAAAVANQGTVMTPWLVSKVMDESGIVVYRAKAEALGNPISVTTAKRMKVLMEDTVTYGTCRKAFRPLRRKKSFQDIELGAKTGTINDKSDRYKLDWVTAYALPAQGQGGVCLTVLAVHGEKLGLRARDIARFVIDHHFTS